MRITRFGAIAAMGMMTGLVQAEPFTYQGQLKDAGAPGNGEYDILFQLFDASSGGTQLGSTTTLANHLVVDGVFQADLDFGDVFDGADRWLQVFVRDGASSGSYTQLSPRTEILATPEAQYAMVAGSVENPQWEEAPGILWYGDGNDRVFINRSAPINGNEFFGVHGSNTVWNGMFVSGPAGSLPFYGYSTDGGIDAYHYYDSGTDSWRLFSNEGVALTVDPARNLIVDNDAEADAFRFSTPKTRYYSIPGDTFSGGVLEYQVSFGNGGFYTSETGSGPFTAPVHLPDGARVISMTAYVNDTAAGDLSISLSRLTHGANGFTTVASVSTFGLSGAPLTLTDNIINFPTVDNELQHYHIRLFSFDWPGNTTMLVKSVRIEYEIDEAN